MTLEKASEENAETTKPRLWSGLKKPLAIFIALAVAMITLAWGITTFGQAKKNEYQQVESLILINYQVDALGEATPMRGVSGPHGVDVAIAVNGKVHNCRSITIDHVEAKKPISTCDDKAVIQPKAATTSGSN